MNDLETQIINELIEKIDNNTLQLASLPNVIIKINEVLADEKKGIHDVAKVIQLDVSLSTRLIQIANSPALRGHTEVTSITNAVTRLGVSLVKNLAICATFKDKFSKTNHESTEIQKMIYQSVQRSVYGYIIAKYVAHTHNPEMALIAGLVRQIGDLVILRYIGESATYSKAINPTLACELAAKFGPSITLIIATKWDFPLAIIEALQCTEFNLEDPASYADVLALTSRYVTYLHDGVGESLDIFSLIEESVAEHNDEFASLDLLFK